MKNKYFWMFIDTLKSIDIIIIIHKFLYIIFGYMFKSPDNLLCKLVRKNHGNNNGQNLYLIKVCAKKKLIINLKIP